MLYRILHPLNILLCKSLFRMEVTGREFIPKKGGILLVSNHTSYLDPVILGTAFPRRLYFFARSELFQNPLFGWLIQKLHAFPVHLGRLDRHAIQYAIEKLTEGETVVVFPEGSRSSDGTLRPGQAGVGFFAVKAGVPVLPVYLRGTHEVLPRGARMIRLKKISAHFGKPLFFHPPTPSFREGEGSPHDITSRRQVYYQEIADQMMASIQRIKDLTD